MTSSGTLMFEGGVRYGSDFWHSHDFGVDITMAFTPLPSDAWHRRMCRITHDFASWPTDIHTWTTWNTDGFGTPVICNCPPPPGHPSNWSAFIHHGPIRQWEANALAAFSRAGVHGFEVRANMPNMTPPVGLENSYHPDFMFINYLQLFQWVQMGNVRQWFTNSDVGKIVTHSSNHNIVPAGHVTSRIQQWVSPVGFSHGPDYWPFEFSAYEHDFDSLPNTHSPNSPYVFWIYDYSNQLGVTLQNLEEMVESPEGTNRAVFPRGHIPHEDTLGTQNGIWAYRWISNRWKYAPWERYPNLMPTGG